MYLLSKKKQKSLFFVCKLSTISSSNLNLKITGDKSKKHLTHSLKKYLRRAKKQNSLFFVCTYYSISRKKLTDECDLDS